MAFALAAAAPPPHQPPGAMTIACVVFIGCMLLFSIGCAIRFRRLELRSLRRCPSCSHDAVRALEPDRVLLLPDGDEDLWSDDYADLVSLA